MDKTGESTGDRAARRGLLLVAAGGLLAALLSPSAGTALLMLGEEPWSPVPAAPPASPSLPSVAGTARDERGAPLGGVEILLTRCGSALDALLDPLASDINACALARTTTDAQGRFELALPGAGSFDLHARRPGFVSALRALDAPGGSDVAGLELMLAAGLSVHGRVVDEGGRGLADVRLAALSSGARRSFAELCAWLDAVGVRSEPDGGFRLGGFLHGRLADLVLWAPSRAARVVPGVQPGRTLSVLLPAAAELAGRVVDGAGRGVPGVRVEARALAAGGLGGVVETLATSAADGGFRMRGWPAGRAELQACAPDGSGWARVETSLAGDVARAVELRLEPAPLRSLLLHTPEGAPLPAAPVRVLAGPGGVTLCSGRSDAAGVARLVLPAWPELRLRVEPAGFLPRELPPGPPGAEDPLELTLERAGGLRLEVVDRGGRPVPNGYAVLAVPGEESGRATRLALDGAGRARSDELVPGVYGLAYADGLAFGPASPRAADGPRLVIRPGRTLRARWSLADGCLLDCRISRSGVPVPRALVGAAADASDLALQLSAGTGPVRADGAGRARLFVRPAGPRIVFARASPRLPASAVPLRLAAGVVELVLELGTSVLEGSVVGAGGEPLAGALVRLAPDAVAGVRREPLPIVLQAASGQAVDWSSAFGVALGEVALRTDERGRYALRDLPAGGYALSVSSPGYAPAAPRSFAIATAEALAFDRGRLQALCRLEGRVGPDAVAGDVRGRGRVQLLDARGTLVAQELLDEEGWYRFDGLAAGSYRARALLPGGVRLEREIEVLAAGCCIGDFVADPGEGARSPPSGPRALEEKER